MKDKKSGIITLVIIIVVVAALIIALKPPNLGIRKVEIVKISSPILPAKTAVEETGYDIDKIKRGPEKVSVEKIADIQAVYQNYPEKDVGDNPVIGWAKANPQDKAKLTEGVDKEIVKLKESLIVNPNDENTKSKLAISESLRKLIANNFNYKMLPSKDANRK